MRMYVFKYACMNEWTKSLFSLGYIYIKVFKMDQLKPH